MSPCLLFSSALESLIGAPPWLPRLSQSPPKGSSFTLRPPFQNQYGGSRSFIMTVGGSTHPNIAELSKGLIKWQVTCIEFRPVLKNYSKGPGFYAVIFKRGKCIQQTTTGTGWESSDLAARMQGDLGGLVPNKPTVSPQCDATAKKVIPC